jgi:hypothetical protein
VAPGCTITVPEQTGLSHIVLANKAGPPQDVEAQLTIQGIKYELHGGLCPGTTTVSTSDGDLTGKVTLKGFVDEGSELATHNSHQYSKLKDGAQVSVFAADGELHLQDVLP